MSITALNCANVSFGYNPYYDKSKLVSIKQFPDYEERKYEIPASTGKKWGVGIASFFVSGLGQAINGDWGKAAGFFFSGIAASVLAKLSAIKGNIAGTALSLGATIGIGIWSIVDAVKNATTEQVQIIPKNK